MSVAVAKQAAFVRHVNSLNAKLASVDVERGSLKRPAYAATRLTVWQSVKRRFPLLAMLMMLQSFSSFILASFSALIEVRMTVCVGGGARVRALTICSADVPCHAVSRPRATSS